MKNSFPTNFDFSLLENPEFKEDSVREEIIHPILNELGYTASGQNRIVRSKAVPHPFVKIGSKNHGITIIPDYLLQVQNRNAWVLDAKSPNEVVFSGKNVEQAYSYAIHPDIRVKLYALCNGKEFVVFSVEEFEPVLRFPVRAINSSWADLKWLLCPQSFKKEAEKLGSGLDLEFVVPLAEEESTIEKEIGVLWSNLLNVEEYAEVIRFKGQLLAETRAEDSSGPSWYELYRLKNGRYAVYYSHVHRGDYGRADLRGVNAWGEYDPPLTEEQIQDKYPALAKEAGIIRIREFDPNNLR